MNNAKKSIGLVSSAGWALLSVVVISTVGGWLGWNLTVNGGSAIVVSPSSWLAFAGVHLFGGIVAALIAYFSALRLRAVTTHFRPLSSLLGNTVAFLGAALFAMIQGGTGLTFIWLAAICMVGFGALSLSLIPMKSAIRGREGGIDVVAR